MLTNEEETYEIVKSTITGIVTITLPTPGVGRHYVILETDGYLKGGAATGIELVFALGLVADPKMGNSGFTAGGARTQSFRSNKGMLAKENTLISVTVQNQTGAADATVCVLRVKYTIRARNTPVEAMTDGQSAPASI